jgi:hypothetical protein
MASTPSTSSATAVEGVAAEKTVNEGPLICPGHSRPVPVRIFLFCVVAPRDEHRAPRLNLRS